MASKHEIVRRLRVFVASPGDVAAEREAFPAVISRLNAGIGRTEGVHLDLWRWEADARPALGEPQALINPELDQADVVVVILWKRLGTIAPAGMTGTEEELTRAMQRWRETGSPRVLVYVCKRAVPMEELRDPDALEQLNAVLRFERSIESSALVAPYSSTEEFTTRLHDDLQATVRELLADAPRATTSSSSSGRLQAPPPLQVDEDWEIEGSFTQQERAHSLRLRDQVREALHRYEFGEEAQDSFCTAYAELFTNASTHAISPDAPEAKIRVSCSVNTTFASLSVFNPDDRPIQLMRWMGEAEERRRRDPFSPSGRGLQLLSQLADEMHVEQKTGLNVVFYRDRVVLAHGSYAGVTILSVNAGHKNPSLATRVSRMLVEKNPEKLILDLGGVRAAQDPTEQRRQGATIRLSRRILEGDKPHSGTTSVIASSLPHFSNRVGHWRIVCPNDALRGLLPQQIVHATMDEAIEALQRL